MGLSDYWFNLNITSDASPLIARCPTATFSNDEIVQPLADAKLPPYDSKQVGHAEPATPFRFGNMPFYETATFEVPAFKLDPRAVGKVGEIRDLAISSTVRQIQVSLSIPKICFRPVIGRDIGTIMDMQIVLEYPGDEIMRMAVQVSCAPGKVKAESGPLPWFIGAAVIGAQSRNVALDVKGRYSNSAVLGITKPAPERGSLHPLDPTSRLLDERATTVSASFTVPGGSCILSIQIGLVNGRYAHGEVMHNVQSRTRIEWKPLHRPILVDGQDVDFYTCAPNLW